MKQYYIFINDEQVGPLNFEELKDKKISRETKVWFEGLEDWKSAGEIEELKTILSSIPPPINSFTSNPLPPKFENKQTVEIENDDEETPKIFGMKRNLFFIIFGVIGVLIVIMIFNNKQNNDRLERIQQNQQTETHNQQIEQQQKEIEEQNNRLAEQEKIEVLRKEKERIEKLEKYYGELNENLNSLYNDLSKAQRNLNDVTAFKLLRSSGERSEQINAAQSQIDFIKNDIKTTEEEMEKVNKKLGIIK
jgi:hypothetical protein